MGYSLLSCCRNGSSHFVSLTLTYWNNGKCFVAASDCSGLARTTKNRHTTNLILELNGFEGNPRSLIMELVPAFEPGEYSF